MRVLVADDEETLRMLLAATLRREGFDVDEAPDGEAAVRAALNNRPDIVISDIMMPRLDGWGLCRILRLLPSTRTAPFLFLTGYDNMSNREQALRLGADALISKPFQLDTLLEQIHSLADRVRDRRNLVAGKEVRVKEDIIENILVDTIEYLKAVERTGVVSVTSGKKKGVILIIKGVPRHAAIGHLRGEEALTEMLRLRNSTVVFKEEKPPKLPRNFTTSWEDFVVKHVYRREENP